MATAYEMAAKFFDTEMIEPLRAMRVGRKLFGSVKTVPRGTFNIDYQTITEMSDAVVSYDLPDESMLRDMIGMSSSTLKIPIIHKGFKIPRAMFDSFATKGIQLDNAAAMSAAQQVAEAENAMLMKGWTGDGSTYLVNGFYEGYGNTTAGSSIGTYGGALSSVADAIALMDADSVFGCNYNLVLHPTQYAELRKSKSTTDIREYDQVKQLLNMTAGQAPGDVFMSSDLTDGTGLVTAVDTSGRFFDLVVAEEAFTEVQPRPELGRLSPLYGHVVEVLVPRIKQSVAITRLTTI
jgi:uncharacterized linocin/CFP29 family protein